MQEAERIVDIAEKQGITLRLFGGVAIRFHCPSATHRSLQRKYADIDFIGLKKQSIRIRKLFPDIGYASREMFNMLQGDKRLVFNDLEHGRRIDIFLDVFEMCHRLDFRNRLNVERPTIPLADLLATKLQVVEMTDREFRDIIALVHDHDLSETDTSKAINAAYIAKLCRNDWGIYKTFTVNISKVLSRVSEYNLEPEARDNVTKRLQALQGRLEDIPKSTRWVIRSKIGERKRWYELPEEDREIVDSRMPRAAN